MQKVFVAGATGVLGRRVIAELVAAGFDVTGVARNSSKQADLAALGARPVVVDLFDRAAVHAAVAGHEVVFNLATAIPVGKRASDLSAWEDNDRIRRDGSRNLVDAALAAGASRYLQESVAFMYADGGEQFLDESAAIGAAGVTDAALVAEAEAARFAEHGGTGVALRFGQFYGFDSGHTVQAIEAALAGRPVELGPESAYRSSVTTDDAASAVIAGLDAPSGVYNVVDDRPLPRAEYVDALADALGVPSPNPRSVNVQLPAPFSVLVRSLRVSNQHFKEAVGWQPSSPSAWEGWVAVIGEWRSAGRARVTFRRGEPSTPRHRQTAPRREPAWPPRHRP
jgi:nucleoside-diphosphate-sugar epimerase